MHCEQSLRLRRRSRRANSPRSQLSCRRYYLRWSVPWRRPYAAPPIRVPESAHCQIRRYPNYRRCGEFYFGATRARPPNRIPRSFDEDTPRSANLLSGRPLRWADPVSARLGFSTRCTRPRGARVHNQCGRERSIACSARSASAA